MAARAELPVRNVDSLVPLGQFTATAHSSHIWRHLVEGIETVRINVSIKDLNFTFDYLL